MDHEAEYTDEFVSFLELIWGEGYLSPGGPDEVGRILDGLDLTGLHVLDIGCGTGGIALSLAADYGAAKVIGVDVEDPVLATANRRAAAKGLADRVEFVKVTAGPLPFGDGEFDLVFSKDSMIHIPDKETLFADVFRLLKPGGWFAASDWLSSHDGEPTPVMKRYMEAEGLSFGLGSPERYREALAAAGFAEIGVVNRNEWYCTVAARELADMEGPLYEKGVAAAGKEEADRNIETWRAMVPALEIGELCPHHLRGAKPG
ncbi:MAG: methyltransferase domain-containing protein [Alphaproteobacteria bacterium]|nr:methyltransferase domain-containing protein [Alphaproteobacteria bacterium]